MRRRHVRAVGVAAFVAATCCLALPADADPRGHHRRRFNPFYDPLAPYTGPYFPQLPPPGSMPDFPVQTPEDSPPLVVEPSPGSGATQAPYPYTQGYVLDVPTATSADDLPPEKDANTLTRYREIADALGRCWSPPAVFDGKRWGDVTLRVSFKRNGAINGRPLIPHTADGLTDQARSDLRQSLLAALQRCTPLNLSPALGGAVAGQIFALRFVQQDSRQ